jgi:hypothetical protein
MPEGFPFGIFCNFRGIYLCPMKRFYFLFFIFLLRLTAFAQTSFYVSPAGNNANSGTLTMPWQTVQYALDRAVAGCTIYLMGGTYNENLTAVVSGWGTSPITLTNYNNQYAVINGASGNGNPLLEINNISSFIVKGIEFANYNMNNARGILVHGNSDNIQLLNNKIHDIHFSSNPNDIPNASTNAQPIIVLGDHSTIPVTGLVIKGNEIFNCRTGYSEAVAVNGNVDGFTISENIVYNISNIGIDIIGHEGTCSDASLDQARNGTVKWNKTFSCYSLYATSAGIYSDGARDCVIENNLSYTNGWGIEVGCENIGKTSSGIIVRNNIVHDNTHGGIVIGGYDYPSGSGKVINSLVNNNTVSANTQNGNASGDIVVSYCESVTIKNNIVNSSGTFPALVIESNPAGLAINFNLYYSSQNLSFVSVLFTYNSLNAWTSATGQDQSSLQTNPLFVNASSNNFHLISTSPAIDRGDTIYQIGMGETDMDTMSRLQNGRIDIGADEFGTAVGIANTPVYSSEFQVIYNSFTQELVVTHLHNLDKTRIVKVYSIAGNYEMGKRMVDYIPEIRIDVSGLKPGVYIADLGDGRSSFRFLKQ